ncbi:MAG: sigma-70 family RNA polymerase sigma factor [Planctomycetes bacterium]|nr:sigma-70 family RNA polymerase sigma factor [Planctomycetota bacterium]
MSEDSSSWPETQWSVIGRTREQRDPAVRGAAWHDLVDTYRIPIETVLRRYLGGRSDVSEAVQSFFGYLYEYDLLRRPSSGEGRFRAFIQAVARRYAWQWRNDRFGHGPLADDFEIEDSAEVDGAAWLPTILEAGLRRMRPKDADLLRRFHGLGLDEASTAEALASELDVRAGAVYKRVHGARLRLREELGRILRELSANDEAWRLELAWLERAMDERLPEPE